MGMYGFIPFASQRGTDVLGKFKAIEGSVKKDGVDVKLFSDRKPIKLFVREVHSENNSYPGTDKINVDGNNFKIVFSKPIYIALIDGRPEETKEGRVEIDRVLLLGKPKRFMTWFVPKLEQLDVE